MFWKRMKGWELVDVINIDDNIGMQRAGCDASR
jgi:hypothetical protein